jgi:hypothetical protein
MELLSCLQLIDALCVYCNHPETVLHFVGNTKLPIIIESVLEILGNASSLGRFIGKLLY